MKPTLATRLFLPVLLGLALFQAWDHLAWVNADVLPQLDSDSSLHGGAMAGGWARLVQFPSLSALYSPGTYPPFVHWMTWLCFAFGEPSLLLMRQAQASFAGLLALGCGLLSRRLWGSWAGWVAAALCFTFPTFYWQRSVIMLALGEAAMLGLAYAFLPSSSEPAQTWNKWVRVLLGGVLMGMAALTHVSMLYWLAATGAMQGLQALVALARRQEGARLHLRDLVLYYGLTALIAGPWYVLSWPYIAGALDNNYSIVTWEQSPWDLIVFIGWLKSRFMAAPVAWMSLAGLACLPFLLRSTPLLLPVLAGMVGGYLGVLSYPHIHARYFLPLVPMVLVLATAPLGLLHNLSRAEALRQLLEGLRPAGWKLWTLTGVSAVLALSLLSYGIYFTSSWRSAEVGPYTADLRFDGALDGRHILAQREQPWRTLLAKPDRWLLHAPPPQRGVWPIQAVVDEVITQLHLTPAPLGSDFGPAPGAPALWTLSPHFGERVFTFEFVARGLLPPVVVHPRASLGELERLTQEGRPGYVLFTRNALGDVPDLETLKVWPVVLPGPRPTELVLARVPAGFRAVFSARRG